MDRRFPAAYLLTLAAAVLAAGLRLWSLIVAVDGQRLPVMHVSVGVLIAAAAVFLALAAYLSRRSPGRSGKYQALRYGKPDFVCALAASLLLLLGSDVDFAEALGAGPTSSTALLLLLGLLGGVGCAAAAWFRRQGKARPAAELAPLLYLLVKLILNFKGWSTDPIILDYCFVLFALIFTLLAFCLEAGFVFDQGKPRRTLFTAMGAVFFCAAAILDGIMNLSVSTAILYAGYLLWQLPVIWRLLIPSAPDPEPEKTEA